MHNLKRKALTSGPQATPSSSRALVCAATARWKRRACGRGRGDDIRTSGQIDITALLRESPQLQASLPGTFSAFNGTPLGASLLNLRNLGTERTLVVENGRRHVPRH
ncbi:MAG: TonB-dependent receptor plug domain-containing protein [Oceanicaulis sp.]|nr:TonB-dependent receptor plug domain-containing protein [Oceanicaulis sp.]